MILFNRSHAIDVFCEFGYPYEWENIGNVYTCTVKNMTIMIPNENVTNIIGTHEKGKTNLDVRKLNIANPNRCLFIPAGFEKFFPNLTGLRVAQADLVSLTHDDLKWFPKLRNVDMFNNDLRTLSSDLFESTPKVDYLYFGDNMISEIGYDIFKPLKNLRKAVFQGNSCIHLNANIKTEIPSFQEKINKNCAKETYFEVQKIKEMEREAEEEAQKLKEHMEKQKDDDSSLFTIWIFSIFIVGLAVSAAYFCKKNSQRKQNDRESVKNFFVRQSETEDDLENGRELGVV